MPLYREAHQNWRGNSASYNSKHKWLQRNHPHPKQCAHCKLPGRIEKGKWNIDYANISGKLLRDFHDWIPLCRPCHRKFDTSLSSFICKKCNKKTEGIFSHMKKVCDACLKKNALRLTRDWKRSHPRVKGRYTHPGRCA